MFGRVAVLLATTVAIGGVAVLPAAASCMVDERGLDEILAEADLVFVGTVAEVRHGTTAQIDVEEVWKGDVPARVTVLGGPDEPDMVTSVDRSWRVGARYLVMPRVADGDLRDDQCSPTREWTDDLAEFRPPTAGAPQPVASPGGPSQGMVMTVAAAVLVLAVAATVVVVRPRRDGPA